MKSRAVWVWRLCRRCSASSKPLLRSRSLTATQERGTIQDFEASLIQHFGDTCTLDQCLKIRREQKIQRQANPSHFTKFGKIWRNLGKFDRNAFDERKEQEFFENTKIG
jgi:hypothetical protein